MVEVKVVVEAEGVVVVGWGKRRRMKDRLQVDDDERGPPPTTRDRCEEGSGATRHTEQNRAHERVDKLQCVCIL